MIGLVENQLTLLTVVLLSAMVSCANKRLVVPPTQASTRAEPAAQRSAEAHADSTVQRSAEKCRAIADKDIWRACAECPLCAPPGTANSADPCAVCKGAKFPCVEVEGNTCAFLQSCRERTVFDLKTKYGAIMDVRCP
jgi:hypothetical protein